MLKAKIKIKQLVILATFFTVGCGQTIYHWKRPNTGIGQFVEDHNACLGNADFFPFKMPDITPGTKPLNVRADWEGKRGVWASYVPYQGASPVVVNRLDGDFTVSTTVYSLCMRKKGYRTRDYNVPTTTHIK